ncbi:uncharacterized protein LOC119739893 [Patiria miniata]|uniref:G-protein coupled receptors family 1 profile domain-containing protein n=1 Tax=Patiria miniata TaxID=46514 RepID=A0A914B3R2_PATMI|nr:uncharacterized protein LOC119739893 [Patiria miniata]
MYSLAPHQLMLVIINCIALVLGAPGNILILHVYFGKPRKTSTHILIMGLALSDLMSLCFTFPLEIVSWSLEYEMEGGRAFCRLVGFGYHYFAQCSVLITVAIAIDRYNAVCRPHQWKITTGRAQGVVASCLLLSAVTSVAVLFSYDIKTIEVDADKVHFESDDAVDRVNITLCDRNVDGTFHKAVFILYTVWFGLLFLVLTMAYLRIYLTIRKRVSGGIATQEEGDVSRMRVVRPVIRFISHLTVVTNREGSAGTPSVQNNTENPSPIDNDAINPELASHSTNFLPPNTPSRSSQDEENSPLPRDEKSATLSGKSTNAFARALLLAGEVPHRPVLPSIVPAQNSHLRVTASPADDRGRPSPVSKPRASPRMATAWSKIKPRSVLAADESPAGGSTREDGRLNAGTTDNKPVAAPIARALQKRAAATAMNLKMQKKTTNMLLVAALTAVLTWFPTIVVEVSIHSVHEWLIYREDWLKILTCFMGWLFLFNFVTNPFVYSLMNSRFREDCSKSFRDCKLCRNKTAVVQNE